MQMIVIQICTSKNIIHWLPMAWFKKSQHWLMTYGWFISILLTDLWITNRQRLDYCFKANCEIMRLDYDVYRGNIFRELLLLNIWVHVGWGRQYSLIFIMLFYVLWDNHEKWCRELHMRNIIVHKGEMIHSEFMVFIIEWWYKMLVLEMVLNNSSAGKIHIIFTAIAF
jgi:hypothetical protein